MKSLTDRQRDVLDFISKYLDDNSFPPTVREIGEHFSISLRAVQDHMTALQRKGYISPSNKRPRSFRLLIDERKREAEGYTAVLPVIARLTPGLPVLSKENYDGSVTVAEPLVSPDAAYFAFRISDDSMINAGIRTGDIAVIRSSTAAEEGKIALVLVGGIPQVRWYSSEAYRVCLRAENNDIPPAYYQEVGVLGILSGILRVY